MPDDFFYDAINLFKYSPTGMGHPNITGPESHRNRYIRLAEDVIAKLWELWATDEIGYASLPRYTNADSQANRRGADIQVDFQYRNNLPITAFLLVHEATHLVRPWEYVIEDILCRNIQYSFFVDLLNGRRIHARTQGGREINVTLTGAKTPRWATTEYALFQRQCIVDNVVNMGEYQRSLKAAFVRQSIDWWGGISNRWAATIGIYIKTLAADADAANPELNVRMLEAIAPGFCEGWLTMERTVGNPTDRGGYWDRVRSRLQAAGTANASLGQRIGSLEDGWGVDLGGFGTAPRQRRCPVP